MFSLKLSVHRRELAMATWPRQLCRFSLLLRTAHVAAACGRPPATASSTRCAEPDCRSSGSPDVGTWGVGALQRPRRPPAPGGHKASVRPGAHRRRSPGRVGRASGRRRAWASLGDDPIRSSNSGRAGPDSVRTDLFPRARGASLGDDPIHSSNSGRVRTDPVEFGFLAGAVPFGPGALGAPNPFTLTQPLPHASESRGAPPNPVPSTLRRPGCRLRRNPERTSARRY